jgi:hypothetical protein
MFFFSSDFFFRGQWKWQWMGGVGSGSGWMGVVPLDKGDQGGENDTNLTVVLAVVGWQWHQSKENVSAVRMVPNRTLCQWLWLWQLYSGCVAVAVAVWLWLWLWQGCGRMRGGLAVGGCVRFFFFLYCH